MRDKTGVKVTANARHAADGIADAVGIKAADRRITALIEELRRAVDPFFVRVLRAETGICRPAIGDVVTLVTNNTYWLVFINSEGTVILLSNGPHNKKPTLSQVIGATLGGSDLRWDWILLGYPLELKGINVTRVRSICLNGSKMMPLRETIQ